MSLSVTSIEVATPPADRLAHLRAEQKRLKKEEDGIRSSLISNRAIRVGARFHAVVSDRIRATTDWQALARKLGATEPQIAEHTTETTYQQVDVVEMPSTADLIRLLGEPVVVIDSETTGLSPASDRIISLAALPCRLSADCEITSLDPAPIYGNAVTWTVNPGKPLDPRAAAVNGFTDEALATLPPFKGVTAIEVLRVLEGAVLVAHNAPFDVGFINMELARHGLGPLNNTVIDTKIVSKMIWPSERSRLDDVCERLGVERTEREAGIHDALGDCRLLARCLPGLVEQLRGIA